VTTEIELRKPLRAEIPQLADLGRRLFQQTFDGLYSEVDLNAFLDRVFHHDGIAADWDDGCEFWVAIDAEAKWVGYCKAGPVRVPIELGDVNALELRQMYVEKQHHRCRIGSRFMERFHDLCQRRKVDQAVISCWSENTQALAFYRSFGFQVIGQYDFMVGQHRDLEYILSKSI
jgi:diamine N-acetyltransferase